MNSNLKRFGDNPGRAGVNKTKYMYVEINMKINYLKSFVTNCPLCCNFMPYKSCANDCCHVMYPIQSTTMTGAKIKKKKENYNQSH